MGVPNWRAKLCWMLLCLCGCSTAGVRQARLLREYEQMWELGRYPGALTAARELLALDLRSRDPVVRGAALARAARAELKNDHAVEARDLYERALKEAERSGSTDPGAVAVALTGLAEARRKVGDPEAGNEDGVTALLQRAISLCESTGDPHLSAALAELGRFYADQGRGDEALTLLERALNEVHDETPDRSLEDQASYLNEIGNVEYDRGHLQLALEKYTKALDLAVLRFGERHSEVARYRMQLGAAYAGLERFADAEAEYRVALDVFIETYGRGSRPVLGAMNSRAVLLAQRGDREGAARLLLELIQAAEQVGNVEITLPALVNLCDNEMFLGNYAEAEGYCQRVVDTISPNTTDRFQRLLLGNAISALGSGYIDRGRYLDAEKYLTRALSIVEGAYGPRSAYVAETRRDLGLVQLYQGNPEAARGHLEFSLALFREIFGDASSWVAQGLTDLGKVELAAGHREQAIELSRNAITRFEVLAKPDYYMSDALALLIDACSEPCEAGDRMQFAKRAWDVVRSLSGESQQAMSQQAMMSATTALGNVLAERGFHREAVARFEQAESIIERLDGPLSPDTSDALRALAWEKAAVGRSDDALRDFERVEAMEEEQLRTFLAGVSEARQRAFLEKARISLEMLVAFQQRYGARSEAAKRLVLRALLRRKARALDASAAQLRQARAVAGPAARSLEELSSRRADLAALVLRGSTGSSEETYHARLEQLRGEIEQLEGRIAESVGARPAPAATVEAVGDALGPRTALLEFIRYTPPTSRARERYAVYVLKDRGRTLRSADLGDARAIDRDVAALRSRLAVPGGNAASAARVLDSRLLEPIEPYLVGVDRLIVAPDAALHLVPFGALVDGHQRYRLQRFEVTYLGSGRDLLAGSTPDVAASPAPGPPVVLGGVLFDQRGDGDAQSVLAVAAADDAATRGLRSSELGSRRFTPLPASEVEAQRIAGALGVQAWLGREASEAHVKAARSPLVLHLATHAFFLADLVGAHLPGSSASGAALPILRPQENPMVRSGLALAGANVPVEAGEDGVLTALEAATLQLSGTELVTLSACDTGTGQIDRGEGVLGLRRGFKLAGARSLLLSLWSVSDAATQRFMIGYYGRLLRGEGRAAALRAVQREFLANPALADPFYWAPFILTGEPGPVPQLGASLDRGAAAALSLPNSSSDR